MVQELRALTSKEVREIRKRLEEQFGFTGDLPWAFFVQEKKEKLFAFSPDLRMQQLDGLKIDSMGLYVGAYFDGQIRLTIEGAQLIGPACTRRIVALDKPQMQRWLQGEQLAADEVTLDDASSHGAFVLMRHGDAFLGCGKVSGTTILNYIPKTRHIHALYD